MNRPFYAPPTSLTDETNYRYIPSNIGNQNVLLTQELQRQIAGNLQPNYPQSNMGGQNILLTQDLQRQLYGNPPVTGNLQSSYPQSNMGGQNMLLTQELQRQLTGNLPATRNLQPNYPQSNIGGQNILFTPDLQRQICGNSQPNCTIQGQRVIIPGGAIFTFQSAQYSPCQQQSQYFTQRNLQCNNLVWQPHSLQDQMTMSELQQHGLDSINYRAFNLNNPFKLQLHYDQQTSTLGLPCCGPPPASQGAPDFSNINGVQANKPLAVECIPESLSRCVVCGYKQVDNPAFPAPKTNCETAGKRLVVKNTVDESHKKLNIFEEIEQDANKTFLAGSTETPPQTDENYNKEKEQEIKSVTIKEDKQCETNSAYRCACKKTSNPPHKTKAKKAKRTRCQSRDKNHEPSTEEEEEGSDSTDY